MPEPDSEDLQQAVSTFYVSLAAIQTDEAAFAIDKMESLAERYPEEAAAWANLGVYMMRQANHESADEHLQRARELQPEHPDILFLSGILESRRGNIGNAIEFLRNAVEHDPQNLKSRYALVSELERQDPRQHSEEIENLLHSLHEDAPRNLFVLYELARIAARDGDRQRIDTYLEALHELTERLPDNIQQQFEQVRQVAEENPGDVSLELSYFRNSLAPLPAFQDHMSRVQLDPTEIGFLVTDFTWLPQPETRAAEPDFGLEFARQNPENLSDRADYVTSVTLLEDLPPLAIHSTEGQVFIGDDVQLDFPGGQPEEPLPANAVAEIDYNYTFMNDLAMAGPEGFRLYEQNTDQTFTDVTEQLNLPTSVINRPYYGVWVADIHQDGDLDIILAPQQGAPVVLRNNGDDTFTEIDLFGEVDDVVNFMWADLNAEGVSDAILLDRQGQLHVYENQRDGIMERREDLPLSTGIAAFTISDIDANALFDIVVATGNYEIQQISYDQSHEGWQVTELASREFAGTELSPGQTRLLTPELDNNGRFDLLVSTRQQSHIWLGDEAGNYSELDLQLPGLIYSVFDIDGNERLDLIGLTGDREPFQMMNSGTKDYHARSIRARASSPEGDRRINSFGIGGEMEVRSGLLYQRQLISSPIVHFGLGEYEEAEMLRIIWTNGSVQAEFEELGMGSTIFDEQILKGSCPWLFTHDGEQMQFVTDLIWRSPLGLRINATETAGVQTLDRVRIPGDMLEARDGYYDLSITAELWETHFFDYVNLVAVDHPEDSEIFVDERFAFPAPDLSTRLMSTPQPVNKVLDQQGNEVTSTVERIDENYLKPFGKTRYQGLVEDHYIEVDLGEEPPADGPLWLVASGWLRPTDSSINYALSQGEINPPTGLHIEVSDGRGGWEEVHEDYGIPAGKTKSILIDLEDAFPDDNDRRIRMHTTSEIYWDAIQWAAGLPDDRFAEHELAASNQELRFRGYSKWERADEVSPKLPDYNIISGTNPRWRDLEGYYTRFGDVSELLAEIDNRYVIMNAGDELRLRYEAPEPPEEGMKRSYVFVSEGWVKDGDYHTEASATVHPLPYHGQQPYGETEVGKLTEDPVYRQNREDWQIYHTRYITPEPFRTALKFE